MTIADRIKYLREYRGLTQEQLAKKMGYASKSAVSRTENAGDKIGQNRIKLFADALDTTVAYLMGWEEDKPKLTSTLALEHINLISRYSKLSDSNKVLVNNLIDGLIANDIGQE